MKLNFLFVYFHFTYQKTQLLNTSNLPILNIESLKISQNVKKCVQIVHGKNSLRLFFEQKSLNDSLSEFF